MQTHNYLTINKRTGIILMAIALAIAAMFFSITAHASSNSKNKKAHKVYDEKLQEIEYVERYEYEDVTWDGVDEALIESRNPEGGSGRIFRVYTYKNGKAKCILKDPEIGLDKITAYKKKKSLITYGAGHGGEWYGYYRYKSGRFKYIAAKSRTSTNGGGDYDGEWEYSDNHKEISKSKFNKLTSKLKKGKKRRVYLKDVDYDYDY